MTRIKSIYLASVVVMLSPAAAYADVIYTLRAFAVSASSDVSEVTGILTLADSYTPGTALAFEDFISFAFSSEVQNYTVPNPLYGLNSIIDIALPVSHGYAITSGRAAAESGFDFEGQGTFLWLWGEGSWESDNNAAADPRFGGILALWTRQIPLAVPEPGTLALLCIGLFGVGLFRRKNQ